MTFIITELWRDHPEAVVSIVMMFSSITVFGWRQWVWPLWKANREAARERALIQEELREVLAQFKEENSGKTLMDQVLFIRHAVGYLKEQITCLNSGLELLYDQAEQAVFFTDQNGLATSMSLAFTRWTGWPESELLGRNWMKIIPQNMRDTVVRQWFDCVSQGVDFSLTYKFQDRDERAFTVHTEAQPVYMDKRIVAYRGTVRRIEEQKNGG